MIAAIYARKSTHQTGVAEDQKSVTRQKELARAFAAARGWIVDERFIFEDDGISGAEFERRPGFQGLMAAAQRKSFQVIVVSEQKSLGREAYETNFSIKQLAQVGVEIWGYMDGRSLTPKNWMDKAMSSLRSAADEAHREDTSKRVHEAHARLAGQGFVVGGRVFGYRNEHVFSGLDAHGNPIRSGTRRVIDPAEAAVVRQIFELYDSGLGLKAIAKHLTSTSSAKPKPFHRADGLTPVYGWSPSTIRTILCRDIYRGVVVWNRSRKRDDWGKVDQRRRPESDWHTFPAEHLRIIPDDLWARVAARRAEVEGKALRFSSGRLSGRPCKETKNLLAGLASCAECGGGLIVETSQRKDGRVAEYICSRRRHNGTCENSLRMSVAEVNESVLQAVEEHALTPEAIEQVIRLTERDDLRERQASLLREQEDIKARIARLVAAIESGGSTSLTAKLRELESRQRDLESQIAGLRPVPRLDPEVIEDRLAEWRRLLRASTTQGRAVLQRILRGRLTFTRRADGTGYDFAGPTRFDKLFTGIIAKRPAFIPVEIPDIPVEDTSDADDGELLACAYGEWVTSPTRVAPFAVAGSVLRRVA
jgi:site-specific DNA recombinase